MNENMNNNVNGKLSYPHKKMKNPESVSSIAIMNAGNGVWNTLGTLILFNNKFNMIKKLQL
jgi:hypothetical protein